MTDSADEQEQWQQHQDQLKEVGKRKSNRSPPYALFNLLVIIVAIIYGAYYQLYLKNDIEPIEATEADQSDKLVNIPMLTVEELKKHNGEGDSKLLYLAIMGEIFDVSRGEKHYGPSGPYHNFVGVDASRAFITGEFDAKNGKSNALDHVLSLTPSELVSLKKWRDFYVENYDFVGRLIGRWFEANGEPTEYFWAIDKKIQFGLKQQEEEREYAAMFPPCNMEFKPNKGTRFWCTKQSGGIERDWAGYPIQLFNQDTKTFSCVCAEKENFDLPQFRKYESCEDKIRSCFIPADELSNDD